MSTLNAKVILNVKTAAEWANSMEILLEGELGIESDTRLIKIGNGTDTYPNLPYTAASDINDIEGVTVTNPTDGNVLTYSNGEWVNITPSSLPADTDLSHYDNSTSGFITASDIPALPADTDLSHYDNTNSDFATVSQIPTDVSQLNNDVGYITSASIPSVGDGTITIQQNSVNVDSFTTNQNTNKTINITVPTLTSQLTNDSGFITASSQQTVNDATLTIQQNGTTVGTFTANAYVPSTVNITVPTKTSELVNDSGYVTNADTVYDGTLTLQQNGNTVATFTANSANNVTANFVTPSGDLTSNTSVLSVTDGTGAAVSNVSLTLDTDLSQYDNSVSQFLTSSSSPMYEKDVTNNTTSDYFMIDPNGSWDTSAYVGMSYVNIVPQRSFVDNDTLYITSPAGGIYTSDISSDTPTLSGSIPAWNDPHYIIIHNTTAGYYALYFSYNEYRIRYFPFNGTATNIDSGLCVGTSSNTNYKITSQDVDSIVKNGYLYIIFSGCWRFYSSITFSCGGFVRSVKVDLSDNSCTPYTITYNNTSYSPSGIPTATDCDGHSRVFFIGDPESTDQSPVACVDIEMRSGDSYSTNTYLRGYWDSVGNITTSSLPKFLGGGVSGYKYLEDLQICQSNSANIAFIATYTRKVNLSVYLYVAAYTQDLTEVWYHEINTTLIDYDYDRGMLPLLVDGDAFYCVYFDYFDYADDSHMSIILEKRDVLTGDLCDQLPKFIDRSKSYVFGHTTSSWNSLYGSLTIYYIKGITLGKYNNYLIISTVGVENSDRSKQNNVLYYWTIDKVAMDPVTDTYLVADKDIVSSSSTGSLGTTLYPWSTGYVTTVNATDVNATNINTSKVNFSSTQYINVSSTTSLAIHSNNKSYTFGSGTGGAVAGSDEILKKNIISMPDGALDIINELRPVKFDFVSDDADTSYYAGFIAQETDCIVPNLTIPPTEDTKNPIYGIDYAGFVPYLVKAIQELSSKVDVLNAKLNKAGL